MASKDLTRVDPKELKLHLLPLFLSCGSLMHTNIELLVKAYRFKQKIEIAGAVNPSYQLFVEMMRRLGISFEETIVKPKSSVELWPWITDPSASSLRIYIPMMLDREGDFHFMFPFYCRYHLTELRKHDAAFPAPKMDSLYVASVWANCHGFRQVSMCNQVKKDILLAERSKFLSISSSGGSFVANIRTVNDHINKLSQLAQLYLGFCGSKTGFEMIRGTKLHEHPFNRRSQEFIGAGIISSPSGRPLLVKETAWSIEEVVGLTKNAWSLNLLERTLKHAEIELIKNCLLGRLQGKSEVEIAHECGHAETETYKKWQVSRCFDIDYARFRDPYKDWLVACEFFGMTPDLTMYESQEVTHETGPSKPADQLKEWMNNISSRQNTKNESKQESVNEFRHSPDYRSIVLRDGQKLVLTERQAGAVRILHEAAENQTPEVSQAYVIEEVYEETGESSLKRLFNDDSLYTLLIEPGPKKGTIRLRASIY